MIISINIYIYKFCIEKINEPGYPSFQEFEEKYSADFLLL